jgi:hypothetical protein
MRGFPARPLSSGPAEPWSAIHDTVYRSGGKGGDTDLLNSPLPHFPENHQKRCAPSLSGNSRYFCEGMTTKLLMVLRFREFPLRGENRLKILFYTRLRQSYGL